MSVLMSSGRREGVLYFSVFFFPPEERKEDVKKGREGESSWKHGNLPAPLNRFYVCGHRA